MAKTQTNGFALSFGTSAWSAKIVSYTMDGETADDVDTADLSSTGNRPYEGGELIEGGTYTFALHIDTVVTRLATGISDIATLTYPISVAGNSTPSTKVFDTYINSFSESGDINALINGSVTIKVAGDSVFTPESV